MVPELANGRQDPGLNYFPLTRLPNVIDQRIVRAITERLPPGLRGLGLVERLQLPARGLWGAAAPCYPASTSRVPAGGPHGFTSTRARCLSPGSRRQLAGPPGHDRAPLGRMPRVRMDRRLDRDGRLSHRRPLPEW
jgi:hypothetical protein